MWGIQRSTVNSPHKWPVKRKMFPFDDVIMVVGNQWYGRPMRNGASGQIPFGYKKIHSRLQHGLYFSRSHSINVNQYLGWWYPVYWNRQIISSYWSHNIFKSMSSMGKDFQLLCHLHAAKWQKVQIHIYASWNKFRGTRLKYEERM